MRDIKDYDLNAFEGDLLLKSTKDGGDIEIKDGLFVCDRAFDTAVYLSLFGGNKDDPGTVKNSKTWWGNLVPSTKESEKMVSRFEHFITSEPMTSKNIKTACQNAALDLAWIKSEGIADKITAEGEAMCGNRFNLTVNILSNGKSVYSNTFALFWKVGVYGSI